MKTLRSETSEAPAVGVLDVGTESSVGTASSASAESSAEGRRVGRPRRWGSRAERHRAAGQRRTERLRLLTELQLALLNARWDDPHLQRLVNTGEELEVLRALIDHFRRQAWARAAETAAAEYPGKTLA